MPIIRTLLTMIALSSLATVATAQANPPAQQQPVRPDSSVQPGAGVRRGPRPYAQVITARAHTEKGGITVHRVDDRYFFEVPDSLMGRDYLMVTRVSGVPAGAGGFQSAGSSLNERMVRWARAGDRIVLQTVSPAAVADDSLPIAKSVSQNNYGAVIGRVSNRGVYA